MSDHNHRCKVVRCFIDTAVSGDVPAFLANLPALDWPGVWHDVFAELVPIGRVDPAIPPAFVGAWRGQGDWTINRPIGINWTMGLDLAHAPDLYVRGLKILTPSYQGTDAPAVLYRGQSLSDHRAGRDGPWWTPYPHIAEWFARSEVRDHTGQRCILAAFNPAAAIISQLCDEEFLLDPSKLDHVELVMTPPPYTAEQEHQDLGSTTLVAMMPHGCAHEAAQQWMLRTLEAKHTINRPSRLQAIQDFLHAAALGDNDLYVAALPALDDLYWSDAEEWPEAWIDVFRAIRHFGKAHEDTKQIFAKQWVGIPGAFNTYAPNGSRLREIFKDHLDLLIDGLRILLPSYQGKLPRVIYRGQSIEEHSQGTLGLSWTPLATSAEFYARAPFSAAPGVVLQALDPGDAIIAFMKPYETEFVVDPRRLKKVEVVLRAKSLMVRPREGGSFMEQAELRPLFDRMALEEKLIASGELVGAAINPAPIPELMQDCNYLS